MAIVDSGSIGRAAELVGISQPSLSRLVRAMEHRLSVQLFDRVTTGMVLTEAGEAFLPHARLLLAELEQATQVIEEVRGLRRGQVRLGAVSSITSTFLPDAIHRFQSAEPGLQVRLVEADTDTLLSQLLKREIDLVIAAELRVAGVAAIARLDFSDRFSVMCSRNHPLAALPRPTLDAALKARWVLQGGDRTPRRLFNDLFERLGVKPPPAAVEADSASTIIALLRNSDCLGWMASRVGEEAGLTALDIGELVLERKYFIFRRQSGLLPGPSRRLLNYLPLIEGTLGMKLD